MTNYERFADPDGESAQDGRERVLTRVADACARAAEGGF